MTDGPQWPYWMPASTRGCGRRGCRSPTAATSWASRCGPSTRPGATVVVTAGEPQSLARSDGQQIGHDAPPGSTVDVGATVGPTTDRIETLRHGGARPDVPSEGRRPGRAELSGGWLRHRRAGRGRCPARRAGRGGRRAWLGCWHGARRRGACWLSARPGASFSASRAQLLGGGALLVGVGGPLAGLLLGERGALLDLGALAAGPRGLLLGQRLLLLRPGAPDLRLLQVLARLLPLPASGRPATAWTGPARRAASTTTATTTIRTMSQVSTAFPSRPRGPGSGAPAAGRKRLGAGCRLSQRLTSARCRPATRPRGSPSRRCRRRRPQGRADRVPDLHDVARLGEVEEPGGALGRQVDAAVGDVGRCPAAPPTTGRRARTRRCRRCGRRTRPACGSRSGLSTGTP